MNGPFVLKSNTALLIAESPDGLYNTGQLKAITELSESANVLMIKAMENQRLGLLVKETEKQSVNDKLMQVGLISRLYRSGVSQPASCVGSMCESSTQDISTISLKLSELSSSKETQSPVRIGLNGCGTCCLPSHTMDISIIAEPKGFHISLGGKTEQFPEFAKFMAQGIPAEELISKVEAILDHYIENAEEGESFHDILDRMGIVGFSKLLEPYGQDAGGHEISLTEVVGAEQQAESDELNLDDLPDIADLENENEADDMISENIDADLGALDDVDSHELDEVDSSDSLDAIEDLDVDDVPVEFEESDDSMSDLIDLAGQEDDDQDLLDDASDLLDSDESIEESSDEEDLEAKITQSIDEESLITYDDRSDKQRMMAVQMVEEIADSEEISEPIAESEEFSGEDEFGDLDINIDDEIQLESPSQTGFAIHSVNQEGNRLIVQFNTGASLTIDVDQLQSGRMEMILNKQKVSIVESEGTILLRSNGIEFNLPGRNAA